MPKVFDPADGLLYRIEQTLEDHGLKLNNRAKFEIKREIQRDLETIQHRIYQYAMAELAAVAFDLSPSTARLPRD